MIAIQRDEIQEFVFLLRDRGIQVGISEHLDAKTCYESLFPEHEESELFLALRSVLAKKREDYDAFSKAYVDFFQLGDLTSREINLIPRFARKHAAKRSRILLSGTEGEEEDQVNEKRALLSLYSDKRSQIPSIDPVSVKPFQPEDIRSIAKKLRKISRVNPVLPGRRRLPHSRYTVGSSIDWRRVAKLVSSNPNALPEIRFKKRKPARSKFVLLADVSGSMLKEAELVINSLFTASRRFHGTEAFVFSIGLSRLTSFFSYATPSLETIQQFYSKQTEIELGSGTRIGENLERLLRDYPTVVSGESTLMIISDGWDLGDNELLDACLREVKFRGAKVVWFHPHFGYADFSPETLAMKTAMPYIDLMIGPLSRAN